MKKIILPVIFIILLADIANAEKYFVLDVNHIVNSLTFNSVTLREIDKAINYPYKSGFLVKTVSFENNMLKEFYYDMSENKNYFIYAPYDKNAARILVYNPNNSVVMDIDVTSFADTCGNGVCEPHESYESCTKDCSSGSKDDFCDEISDGICDPDCSSKTDADCEGSEKEMGNVTSAPAANEKQKQPIVEKDAKKPVAGQSSSTGIISQLTSNYLIWVLLVFAIVVFISLFLFIKQRKENKIIDSLKQYVSENTRRGFTEQQIKDTLFREGYTQKEIDKAIKPI